MFKVFLVDGSMQQYPQAYLPRSYLRFDGEYVSIYEIFMEMDMFFLSLVKHMKQIFGFFNSFVVDWRKVQIFMEAFMDATSLMVYQCCDRDQVYVFKKKDNKIYMKTYDIFMNFLRKTNISPELQRTLFIPLKNSQEKKWGAFSLEGQPSAPSPESIQHWIQLVRQGQFSAPVEKITISDYPHWPLCQIKQLSSGHLIAGTWMNVVISDPKRDFENVQIFNKNINHQGNYKDCCELSNGDLITAFTGSKQTDKEGNITQNTPSSLDVWRRNGKSFEHQRVILEDNRDFPGNVKTSIPSVVELKSGLIATAVESDIKFWDPKLDYKW